MTNFGLTPQFIGESVSRLSTFLDNEFYVIRTDYYA
jgi:hypothetical protein